MFSEWLPHLHPVCSEYLLPDSAQSTDNRPTMSNADLHENMPQRLVGDMQRHLACKLEDIPMDKSRGYLAKSLHELIASSLKVWFFKYIPRSGRIMINIMCCDLQLLPATELATKL